MLIVMKQDATPDEIAGVVEVIQTMGYEARPMPGRQRTTVGLVGNDGRVDASRVEALAGVAEVRVKGAIGAVELAGKIDLDALRSRFAELGVWVRPFGNVVYLMPPFVIAADDLATLTAAVRRVLTERAQQL